MLAARLKRFDAAEQAFQKVVQLAPENAGGYEGLVRLYLSANTKLAQAKRYAQAAVRLSPTAYYHYLLGETCARTGDTAGALAALKRAVDLEPGNREYLRRYEQLRTKE